MARASKKPQGDTTKATASSARPAVGARGDRSFGEVLRTKSPDRVVPDLLNRAEAGRRSYVRGSVGAIEAELGVLRDELKRAQGEEDTPLAARLAGAIAAIGVDLRQRRATAEEFDRAVLHQPGGWTVFGRVLLRTGESPPKGTAVEFLTEKDEPVKELGSLPVEGDGAVRKAYGPEVVAKISANVTGVHAVVREGRRIVAADTARVKITADGLYQFDLRVDVAR